MPTDQIGSDHRALTWAARNTYLRQAALIAILAQMGSWVPADSALLPVIDRIFTRIGASVNMGVKAGGTW